MTMISFRVSQTDAEEVQRLATALGVARSQIFREALRRHLVVLRGARDADRWERAPASDDESSLAAIADWGPAEDWADWADAAR